MEKKYVVVTGAYGGMGQSTVNKLVNEGYLVFAFDKVVGEAAENVFPIQVDLTNIESVKIAFEKVKNITTNLFAIVHFAGVYKLDSLVEMEDNEIRHIFDVNLFGAINVNKVFFPLLKKSSKILITTSELAPLDPLPFTGIYAVTKGALDKYAFSLRMELQLLGIDVSVLRAGAVSTSMLGVSTKALDNFCEKTKLYECNATRFRSIVNSVESKNISPDKIAQKTCKILTKSKPKFAYSINKNRLLILLSILPKRLQFFIIKKILKK